MTQWRIGLVYLFILNPTAFGQEIGRRGFLASGAFSMVGRLFSSAPVVDAQPALRGAPVVESPISPAMARFRGKQLTEMLDGARHIWADAHPGDSALSAYLSADQSEIVEDWLRHNPERAHEYLAKVRRLDELRLSDEDSPAEEREFLRLEGEVAAPRDGYPWSTSDWGKVFGERIARAEKQFAIERGIDEALVWQMTEHLIEGPSNLLEMIRTEDYDINPKPIYSTKMIEGLATAVEMVSKAYANSLRTSDSVSLSVRGNIRSALLPERVEYAPWRMAPVKFIFANDDLPDQIKFNRGIIDAATFDAVAALYARLLSEFATLERRLGDLPESTTVKVALEEVRILINEAHNELRTLPLRYAAYVREADMPSHLKPWNASTWASFDQSSQDPIAALAWARKVEALAVTYQTLAPVAVEMLARFEGDRTCEPLLAENGDENTRSLEHAANASLNVGDVITSSPQAVERHESKLTSDSVLHTSNALSGSER